MTDDELREIVNFLFVACPTCAAKRGAKCTNQFRAEVNPPHRARRDNALVRFKEIFALK